MLHLTAQLSQEYFAAPCSAVYGEQSKTEGRVSIAFLFPAGENTTANMAREVRIQGQRGDTFLHGRCVLQSTL